MATFWVSLNGPNTSRQTNYLQTPVAKSTPAKYTCTYLYLRGHSPVAGWAGITNRVDHVSDGSTLGTAVLRELTRHFHPVLSPSCVAEDSRFGGRFQVSLDRGSPCLQLASRSSAPRAARCGKENVLDQLTCGTSCGMTKPAEPSLHERLRQRRRRSSTDDTQTSLRLLLLQPMTRSQRVKLSALLPGRPCATIYHATTRITGERMQNEKD